MHHVSLNTFTIGILALTISCGKGSSDRPSQPASIGALFVPNSTDSAPPSPTLVVWKVESDVEVRYHAANCDFININPQTGSCDKAARNIVSSVTKEALKDLVFGELEKQTLPELPGSEEVHKIVREFVYNRAWSLSLSLGSELQIAKAQFDRLKQNMARRQYMLSDPKFENHEAVVEFKKSAKELAILEVRERDARGPLNALEVAFDSFLEKVDIEPQTALGITSPFESYDSLFVWLIQYSRPLVFSLGADEPQVNCKGRKFKEGRAWIECREGEHKYLINTLGREIKSILSRTTFVNDYSDGVAVINESTHYHRRSVVDREFLVLSSMHYLNLKSFSHGAAVARHNNSPYLFLVNKQLQEIPNFSESNRYTFIGESDSSGFRLIEDSEGNWHYLKPDLTLIKMDAKDSGELGGFYRGRAMSWNPRRFEVNIIDIDGKDITNISIPFEVGKVNLYADVAIISAKHIDSWIIANPDGIAQKNVLPKPSSIQLCENNWYLWQAGNHRLVNRETLIELKVPKGGQPTGCFSKENLAPVKIGDKYTYITTSGELAWGGQRTFTAAEEFSDGLAYVETDTDRGYISSTGEFYLRFTNKPL